VAMIMVAAHTPSPQKSTLLLVIDELYKY
jgi:hypothetical protein